MKHEWMMAGAAALVCMGGAASARPGGSHSSGSHYSSRSTGEHTVSGYTTRSGTYVAPHYATNPNSIRNDNYSTRGNYNPHTGTAGTKPRDGELATQPY